MLTLVLGGTRSGKSAVAERLAGAAAGGYPVRYVATAVGVADDPTFAERVDRHRRRRPDHWETVETGPDLSLTDALRFDGVALVDSLGSWLAAHHDFAVDSESTAAMLASRPHPTVVVSEEVGLGVHPATDLGIRFADALGELNLAVSLAAHEVRLVVAGRSVLL